MFGTGQLPKFEADQFEIKFDNSDQENFYTTMIVLTNLVRTSIIEKNLLPKDLLHQLRVLEKKQEVTEKTQKA